MSGFSAIAVSRAALKRRRSAEPSRCSPVREQNTRSELRVNIGRCESLASAWAGCSASGTVRPRRPFGLSSWPRVYAHWTCSRWASQITCRHRSASSSPIRSPLNAATRIRQASCSSSSCRTRCSSSPTSIRVRFRCAPSRRLGDHQHPGGRVGDDLGGIGLAPLLGARYRIVGHRERVLAASEGEQPSRLARQNVCPLAVQYMWDEPRLRLAPAPDAVRPPIAAAAAAAISTRRRPLESLNGSEPGGCSVARSCELTSHFRVGVGYAAATGIRPGRARTQGIGC
jgi:hypothetical protein